MTSNDRTQISILALIAGISDNNYFNELSPKFLDISSNGMKGYHKITSDKEFSKNMPKIEKFFGYVDNTINEKNWRSSMTFLLSFVLGVSDDLLSFLKDNKKRKVWEELRDLASKELSKNYSNFLDEIEKAEEMLDLIYNYNWE